MALGEFKAAVVMMPAASGGSRQTSLYQAGIENCFGLIGFGETLIFMGVTMSDANFEDKLEELLKSAGSVPPQQEKVNLLRKSKSHHDQLQQKLATLQQSLDYLRLSIKYLIFDLEATRRENVDLRKRLNEKRQDPPRDF